MILFIVFSLSIDFLILWWLERLLVLMLENALYIKWDVVNKTYRRLKLFNSSKQLVLVKMQIRFPCQEGRHK